MRTAKLVGMTVAENQTWQKRTAKYDVKVLGIVKGYVVYRRKGAAPLLLYWKDFEASFVQVFISPRAKV